MYGSGSGWCDTCFCFRDIRRAILAIGMFSGFVAVIDILISVAEFTGGAKHFTLMGDTKEVKTYQLFVALAVFDFVLFLFSFCLIYGNERSDETTSRNYLLPWAVFLPFYVIFDTACCIHYFYYQLNDKYEGPLNDGNNMGYVIVPLVYWIIKDIVLFISFMFVVIRVQYLLPTVRYVREIEPCHACPAPAPMMSLPPAPTIPRPVPALPRPPNCTSCSSGGCNADRCRQCNLPQPMYGYAGFNTGNNAAGRTGGWTTSIYNTGGF